MYPTDRRPSTRNSDSPESALDSVPPIERMTLRLADVVKALGVSRRTIERERSAGRFPAPDLRIGKSPLWRPETIRAWIERGGE